MSQKPKPKKVFLLDTDFFYKNSKMPNFAIMKISSYHKQKGDYVMMVTEEYHLTGTHDLLYLAREQRTTPFPPGDWLDDKRTILVGKEFEIFDDVYQMPNEVAALRPDYQIYEFDDDNIFGKANFVQFFNGNTKLKLTQNWRRFKYRATVVVDTNFWDFSPKTITECLNTLYHEHNVIFLAPVKLSKLMDNDVFNIFSSLKLAKFYKLRYNNNIGEDLESVKQSINILSRLKEKRSYLNIGSLPVKIITKDHWNSSENIMHDFERCLKIMTYAQEKKVRINMRYPKLRLSSPAWYIFEFFKTWSNHLHYLSFVEAMLKGACLYNKQPYYVILNETGYWNTARIKQVIHLLLNYQDLIWEYGFVSWDGKLTTSRDLLKLDYIREKAIDYNIL